MPDRPGSKPLIALLLGSESDRALMQDAVTALEEFGIGYELHVLSAHRSPSAVAEFAASARERGFRVVIAAAGHAAHLAGAVAARTTLPVIGVPLATSTLGGLDSLLSTVQMPSGVPVATVAINGARNAVVLAAQMLALSDDCLAKALAAQKEKLAQGS